MNSEFSLAFKHASDKAGGIAAYDSFDGAMIELPTKEVAKFIIDLSDLFK